MNDRARTVAIVAPYFPPHTGGLERYAYEIAQHLKRDHAWRVVVITTSARGTDDRQENLDGITIYRLGYRFKISNTPMSFQWFSKVRKILKEENPDIVNVHTPVPGLGDIAALVSGRKPLIVTYHAGSMKKGRFLSDVVVSLYENLALPIFLRRAEKIICSSEAVRTRFLKRYKHKSITIPPAVDHATFVPNTSKVPGNTVLFAASDLSRSSSYKGLSTLLDAVALLRDQGVPVKLAVIGDGDMRAEYESAVRAHGLEGSVEFLGRLSGSALIDAYRNADIFSLPTSNDSYPTVILEAMSCGLPVVATSVGDIPTIVENGITGFCVQPHNASALAEKLELLLINSKLAKEFGAASRSKVEKNMSWAGNVLGYHDFFVSAIEKLHITQISAYYPPHLGGIERMVKTSSELLAARGHNVVVITSRQGTRKVAIHEVSNLTVKRLFSFEFAHTPWTPTLLWHVLRIPRRSIIHLHLAQAYWPELVRFAAFIKRMPYIVHFHLDVGPSGTFGRLFTFYKKVCWGPLLRHAKGVIVCSPDQIALLETKYGVERLKISVVPNAVAHEYFVDFKNVKTTNPLRLVSISRLAPQKRLERLIEAMRELKSPAQLTIVGDGEERAKLEDLVKKYELSNVTFVGAKNDEEMRAYLQQSDLFLIASDREGMPLAVLEAMAAGLPIVGSDVSGTHELLDGVGILVQKPYPQSLARAIEELSHNPDEVEKLSRKSREKAAHYTWPITLAKLEGMYRTI